MSNLTPEDLDEARIKEAVRRGVITTPVKSALSHLCDVFNEGWTPLPKVDPDLLAAREWCATSEPLADVVGFRNGNYDKSAVIVGFLAGIKHGRGS